MNAVPDFHIRRMAEQANLRETGNHPAIPDLTKALDLFPFRTAIAMPTKPGMAVTDLPPIMGAVALVPGMPFDGQDLADAVEGARQALENGGTFLVLAADRHQRDDAKARIPAALGILLSPTTAGGRA